MLSWEVKRLAKTTVLMYHVFLYSFRSNYHFDSHVVLLHAEIKRE